MAAASEKDKETHKWEKSIKDDASFLFLNENEEGELISTEIVEERKKKRRVDEISNIVQRGMIRYLYLIIDLSSSVANTDLKPNRQAVVLKHAISFIKEFFDQNPISQMGLIITREGKAEKLTELGGNPQTHIRALEQAMKPIGLPSIQNSLSLARTFLREIPSYGSREAVFIYSAMSTCDPGDIFQSVQEVVEDRIRCSVIGLSAEIYICRHLAEKTQGTYFVALHEEHFKELLFSHVCPPPVSQSQNQEASLIRMGFPKRTSDAKLSFCVCHKELRPGGFLCPRCHSKFCELPTDCSICNLTLVSSPHLARSYHHLFPVPAFKEVPAALFSFGGVVGEFGGMVGGEYSSGVYGMTSDSDQFSDATSPSSSGCMYGSTDSAPGPAIDLTKSKKSKKASSSSKKSKKKQNQQQLIPCCFGCLVALIPPHIITMCERCNNVFCADCDSYIHDSLHNCPGCESGQKALHPSQRMQFTLMMDGSAPPSAPQTAVSSPQLPDGY